MKLSRLLKKTAAVSLIAFFSFILISCKSPAYTVEDKNENTSEEAGKDSEIESSLGEMDREEAGFDVEEFLQSLPEGNIPYFKIRIELKTDSDWSTLDIENPGNILSLKLVEKHGMVEFGDSRMDHLEITQELVSAEKGLEVGISVDCVLSVAALDEPVRFVLKKGDLNGSSIRIYGINIDESHLLLKEIEHDRVILGSDGFNPVDFTLDLSGLKKSEPMTAEVSRLKKDLPKLLWAFYYSWYDQEYWKQEVFKDFPYERYNSYDVDTIKRQVDEAKQAGIDGFIFSWWGPGSTSDDNLKKVLEIAGKRDFQVSIYFETLDDFGELRDTREIYDWLEYFIKSYRDDPDLYRIDGKLLINLWASAVLSIESWEDIIGRLKDQGLDAVYLEMGYNILNLDLFDGLHDYAVCEYEDLDKTFNIASRAVRYYSIFDRYSEPKIWVATVQPGLDTELCYKENGFIVDRQNGDYYGSTFEAAINSDPDFIYITSWNEWPEHTYIEPGGLYGDQYLDITSDYAKKWKGNN